MSIRSLTYAILALGVCSGVAGAQIPASYQLVALADLLPIRGAPSNAKAVSHSGHVAGDFSDAFGRTRAVIWERTGPSTWRAVDLAQETGLTSGWSQAFDVNDRGEVVGTYRASLLGTPSGMRWHRNSSGRWGVENLGPGEIRSINNDTEFSRNTPTGDILTYSWRAPGGPIVPRPLKGASNAINDPGAIAAVFGSGATAIAFVSRSIAFPFAESLPGGRRVPGTPGRSGDNGEEAITATNNARHSRRGSKTAGGKTS